MLNLINARNVNDALGAGIRLLLTEGIAEESRNGPVLVAPGPVMTVYSRPWERVLFSPTRNANPFFHFMESLWMLAGREDLAFPKLFNSNFGAYSDDGTTIPGAYGYRWRRYFGYDQIEVLITELKNNCETRRAVLSMWDGGHFEISNSGEVEFGESPNYEVVSDLHRAIAGSKDIPCNTHAYFDCRGGKLNMTVCCRSNDIIWGAYGANAVHFSILQEYMAARMGIPQGEYRQLSNNYHMYTDIVSREKARDIAVECDDDNYNTGCFFDNPVTISKLLRFDSDRNHFLRELHDFLQKPAHEYSYRLLSQNAVPMCGAWQAYKSTDYRAASDFAEKIELQDWRRACVEWLGRAEQRHVERGNGK